MHRLPWPYLPACSLCCNCQWEAFGVAVPPAIECRMCIHQSVQFSLSSSLTEICLELFLLSGVESFWGSPSNLVPPLCLFDEPVPIYEYISPTKTQQKVQLWRRRRLIKCEYLFTIIFCHWFYELHPSVNKTLAIGLHLMFFSRQSGQICGEHSGVWEGM